MEAILRELGRGDLVSNEGLWQRIDEKLHSRKVKHVILCPDKALALFPHHGAILNIGRDGQKECVLDRYEIVYLPQGALAQMTHPNLQTPRLLIFGTNGEELSSLGTMRLRDLAPDCIKEWYSQDGREKFAAEISKINALTFLGHGKYDWEEPSLSFLGLCMDHGGTGFNDLITLENLVKLIPSHLNLIVLAGCETGLPRITTKVTDYKGFAEDLLSHRNISAIISTLWPIPQISTVLLMRQFHKYWLLGDDAIYKNPLSPATALRKAQLWLRTLSREQVIVELETMMSVESSEVISKEIRTLEESIVEHPYAHPYFWSTFYLMGDV
jgi:CHAT domain-containing protein